MDGTTTAATLDSAATHQVAFKLTYANRDLVWFGDAASPTSMVYIQPEARPIATDFLVTTLAENNSSPAKRYMREARIAVDGGTRVVYAFTTQREKVIGAIDKNGHFTPNDFYTNYRELLPTWPADPSNLAYDAKANALYYEVELPSPAMSETLDFLPLNLSDADSKPIVGRFTLSASSQVAMLVFQQGAESVAIAKAKVPRAFRRDEVLLGSFDNESGTYLPEAAYRPGTELPKEAVPSVTFTVVGEFTSAIQIRSGSLVLEDRPSADAAEKWPTKIAIDGKFDDWRNVAGVDDPRGDLAPYLEYVPDVDLLEFKVANDDERIYLYARVAGQVGRTHPDGGRGYFYAYMDVDQNPRTGFLPTRDDDCYYGVEIGDDCEVQFEFVNNAFRKTFYGFCGLGGDDNVLKQMVTLGKSQYGRLDDNGVERENYKSEYIFRDGVTEITEDLKLGTSDTIQIAVSPDGSEVEVSSAFTGFLKDPQGRPTVSLGQTIDLAAGMESDSKAYSGKTRWAADSTAPIRGYRLRGREKTTDSRDGQQN